MKFCPKITYDTYIWNMDIGPSSHLERCDSQPPAWWEQPTIAATSWQNLNVNIICATELLTIFVHQNVNTICASECPLHQISVKSVQSVTHSHPTSWHEGDNCLESLSDLRCRIKEFRLPKWECYFSTWDEIVIHLHPGVVLNILLARRQRGVVAKAWPGCIHMKKGYRYCRALVW